MIYLLVTQFDMKIILIFIPLLLACLLTGSLCRIEDLTQNSTRCCTSEAISWMQFCCCLIGKPIDKGNCSKCFVTFLECLQNCSTHMCRR
ncbi:unnamed protein product [Lactuca virosa]|uniref:Uncharacterized protein n=1 Tax=Lactuca virosa TaxID=75947 RepID=A0AAU9LPN2_9ASTR|nr:unnamed protein product [Lactuca virosa]